jgi:hypothetical protein
MQRVEERKHPRQHDREHDCRQRAVEAERYAGKGAGERVDLEGACRADPVRCEAYYL